ncbi:MAG: hypothetical protein OWU84_15110 [Firmicutes bacterium]|nr:hypothetical protein [Bacillota bacterium]
MAAYKQAWPMERAFRAVKTHLDLHPMFHGTEARIQGHVTVCVLALVLESILQRLLCDAGCPASTRTVLADLERVQAVPLTVGDHLYLCCTPLVGQSTVAFRVDGGCIPLGITPSSCHGPVPSASCRHFFDLLVKPKPGWIRRTSFAGG